MAEVRQAIAEPKAARRGPISMKNVHHLEVHPSFDGKVAVHHHYEQTGGHYMEPAVKKMEPEAAVKHIAGFLGLDHTEPGGKSPREVADAEPAEAYAGHSESEELGE